MMLEIQGVSRNFSGVRALNRVDIAIPEGVTMGIIGPNGAGKSTLFGVISGFYPPSAGEIKFRGEKIDGMQPHELCRQGICRAFQIVQTFPDMTVAENILVAAFLREHKRHRAMELVYEVLEQVGLGDQANTMIDNLTIADRKRLELAKALATRPVLILLDEVMAGLNEVELMRVVELIRAIRATGIQFVLVEHVMKAVTALTDRVCVLNYGQKIAEGPPGEVLRDPKVVEAYLGQEVDAHA